MLIINKYSGSYSVKGHFKDLHAHLHKRQYELYESFTNWRGVGWFAVFKTH